MDIFLQNIHPLIQRYIAEVEERLERKMGQHNKRKVMDVQHQLDTFELWFIARPAPIVDVTAPQAALESLRSDLDTILEAPLLESEARSLEPFEDTVLADFLSTTTVPQPQPGEHAKRPQTRY